MFFDLCVKIPRGRNSGEFAGIQIVGEGRGGVSLLYLPGKPIAGPV
jgi:hypothetical protein